jgi:chorismate mutase
MYCRGIRGAITVESNDADQIIEATKELLQAIVSANSIRQKDIASAIFSTTPDLNAAFPAKAARDLGWTHTALFCSQEMDVPGSLPLCVRVLIHWNTDRKQDEIVNIYLREARNLRPDINYNS